MVNFNNSNNYNNLIGMKKMVVNHLEKIFVTSDAATIMSEVILKILFLIFLD